MNAEEENLLNALKFEVQSEKNKFENLELCAWAFRARLEYKLGELSAEPLAPGLNYALEQFKECFGFWL